MCILATAIAGAEFSRDTLEDMFWANPDGAGWAYAKNGKIYFSKGYTSANKFIRAVQKLPRDVERMVHCRIGTHGGITKALTHPFPVSTSYAKMEMLAGTLSSGYILAHNGILSNFTPDKKHSDTEELVRCLANIKQDIMGEDMRDIIEALIDGSRVAILNTDGVIKRYGSGWTEKDGIFYSNMHFARYSAYNNYGCYTYDWDTYGGAYYEKRLPAIEDLVLIGAGEVIKNIYSQRAFITQVDGAYLLDERTHDIYGVYKGEPYETNYRLCDCTLCQVCNYKCPIKDACESDTSA